jgi:hypothetical protein
MAAVLHTNENKGEVQLAVMMDLGDPNPNNSNISSFLGNYIGVLVISHALYSPVAAISGTTHGGGRTRPSER